MSNYIVNTLLFQLLFLGVYELFFKKETFFTTNRFYLIGSFITSLIIPNIKIPNFFENNSPIFNGVVTQSLEEFALSVNSIKEAQEVSSYTVVELILISGMIVSAILFLIKLYRIYQLKKDGKTLKVASHTQVILPNTDIVFSFLNTIFIGDKALQNAGDIILKHEMVHIHQKHTLDLLLFEILRIVFWFNPLVYIYQSKVSEVHEYISDKLMSTQERKAKYELLLQQLFKTQNISFVNSFYKKSLIKKRIIMLQKDYSDKRKMLKYLLVIPIIASMLVYSSCNEKTSIASKQSEIQVNEFANSKPLVNPIIVLDGKVVEMNTIGDLSSKELYSVETSQNQELINLYSQNNNKADGVIIYKTTKYVKGNNSKSIPFASVDKVPVFPGCENSEDPRICFVGKIQEHIRKYFIYPEEAQLNNIQGRVFVQFTVSYDGSISFIRTRGPEKVLEDAARAIIEKLPKMIPGEHNGKQVDVPFSIPISYVLK